MVGTTQGDPRLAILLPLEQPFELPVELPGPAEELGPEGVEFLLLEQEVFADAGIVGPDRLLRQGEPGPLPLVGRLQVGVGLDLTPIGDPRDVGWRV